jgi:amidophosphoribosyltransferase
VGGELREACGVFGVFGQPGAAPLTYRGLFALQHRGQESAGIAWLESGDVRVSKGMGLVAEALDEGALPAAPDVAMGHVRYSTTGPSTAENAQPLVARTRFGPVALAHNGNLTNFFRLKARLEAEGAVFQTTSDSELLAHLVARRPETDVVDAVLAAVDALEGGFAYLLLLPRALIGVRDPHGIRPLVLGRLESAFVLASETCALDAVGADFLREVEPGELVVITDAGVRSVRREAGRPAFCVFELVYFARADSVFRGRTVHEARRAMGRQLAREHPVAADVVVGVPDSSLPAAMGYAEAAGLPFDFGLVKNRYVGRTFIAPGQTARELSVSQKLAAVRSVVAGRRVVLVDDSLVRGTTSRHLVQLLRRAGATAVHMRIASPPYKFACHYGIDTSRADELAAARWDLERIRREVGADSLAYLSVEGLERAVGTGGWCLACFGGGYPVPVEEVLHERQ